MAAFVEVNASAMFDAPASSYDKFMGRFSFRLGPPFADFARVASGQRVLDVGAGTGALTSELVRRGAVVSAAEPSPSFVATLAQRLPGVDVRAATAEELPWPDETFDAALAQLVLAFMNDAQAGVAEMRRVVRTGGAVAVCMWDRTGMEMLSAIQRTHQALGAEGAAKGRPVYRVRDEIEGLFAREGFADVRTELLEVESEYASFDELWDALVNGAGPAVAWAQALDDDGRARAQAELRRQVGEPQGAFTLRGRAWATCATRV